MLYFLLFVPFLLDRSTRSWDALQALTGSIILLFSLVEFSWRHKIVVPLRILPWLIWPLLLLVRTSDRIEYFSEFALSAMSLFMFALLVFQPHFHYNRWKLWVVISHFMLLAVQVCGIAFGLKPLAIGSVFCQENQYQMFNLFAILVELSVLFDSNIGNRLRFGMYVPIALGATSLVMGDTVIGMTWKPSAGDAVTVWFGLFFLLFVAAWSWIWQIKQWSVTFYQAIIALIGAFFLLLPLLLVKLPLQAVPVGQSLISRQTYWMAAVSMIKHNFWFGVGWGRFGATIQDYWPALNEAPMPISHFPIVAHNQALQIWAELGFFGFLVFSALLLIPLYQMAGSIKNRTTKSSAILFLGLLCLFPLMAISEVTQMFYTGQMLLWSVVVLSARSFLVSDTQVIIQLPRWIVLTLVPIVGLLSYDRYTQVQSSYLTRHLEVSGVIHPGDAQFVNRALEIHSKNGAALFNLAEMHRLDGNYSQALQAVDVLQGISGTLWPVNRMRAMIFASMGDTAQACRWARWPILYSAQPGDQKLQTMLKCHE